MGNVMRRASQVLSERGEQFAEAAQKVSYSDLLEIKLHIVMNIQAVK